jgi:hypothetical protein
MVRALDAAGAIDFLPFTDAGTPTPAGSESGFQRCLPAAGTAIPSATPGKDRDGTGGRSD